MTATATPHIRVDEGLDQQAAETLDQRGLSLSDAGCIFLERAVVEEGLPPTRKIPNARTRAAIAEAGLILEPVNSLAILDLAYVSNSLTYASPEIVECRRFARRHRIRRRRAKIPR